MQIAVGWKPQVGLYYQTANIRRSVTKYAKVNIPGCKTSASSLNLQQDKWVGQMGPMAILSTFGSLYLFADLWTKMCQKKISHMLKDFFRGYLLPNPNIGLG